MAFVVSMLIIAAGAIMRFAYTPTSSGSFNWSTAGGILMIIGIVGAVVSAVVWAAQSYRHTRSTTTTQGPGGQILRRDDVESRTSTGA